MCGGEGDREENQGDTNAHDQGDATTTVVGKLFFLQSENLEGKENSARHGFELSSANFQIVGADASEYRTTTENEEHCKDCCFSRKFAMSECGPNREEDTITLSKKGRG